MGKKQPEEEKINPILDEEKIKQRNQKIAIGFIIVIVLIIIGLLVWPLINTGSLIINTNNIGATFKYCKLGPLQEDELSPHRGGCPASFDTGQITIENPSTILDFPSGEYYLYLNQDGFSPVESSATIRFGQTSEVTIDLLPLTSKYIDDYTADISTNPNTPYIIKYLTGYENPDTQEGYFEKYVIENLNTGESIMDLTGFEDIIETNWAPDNSKFFMTATSQGDDSATEKKYLVNLTEKTVNESNLPEEKITWAANSEKVYYIFHDISPDPNFIPPSPEEAPHGYVTPLVKGPNHDMLTMANPDGSDWQRITKIDSKTYNDPDLFPSPDGQSIIIIPTDQLAYIYKFDTNEIKRFSDLDFIYSASWSPNSELILFETYYQNKPALYITNPITESYTWTKTQSFIYKTTWQDNNTLLFTVPNYIPGPDDIPYNPIDIIKKINFTIGTGGNITFEVSPIIESNPTINNAIKLLYIQEQNTLYLLDYENYLNALPLS